MASTFTNLCGYADWSESQILEKKIGENGNNIKQELLTNDTEEPRQDNQQVRGFDLNYDIHIHLLATRDQAVYDALFASLAKHISLK